VYKNLNQLFFSLLPECASVDIICPIRCMRFKLNEAARLSGIGHEVGSGTPSFFIRNININLHQFSRDLNTTQEKTLLTTTIRTRTKEMMIT
jgi:hypothetical protein